MSFSRATMVNGARKRNSSAFTGFFMPAYCAKAREAGKEIQKLIGEGQ